MENLIDLHKIREELKTRKIKKLERETKIRELTEKMNTTKAQDMVELERRRTSLLNDKEQRDKHDITTQKAWEKYIKNTITKKEEDRIIQRYNEVADIVHELENAVKIDRIKITDLEWQLRIELAGVDIGYGLGYKATGEITE